jgi:NADPH:quinone reductase-like Zn-dependent oxidoreductase
MGRAHWRGQEQSESAPPLTLGSDVSGVGEEAGPSASPFKKGDEVYGVLTRCSPSHPISEEQLFSK